MPTDFTSTTWDEALQSFLIHVKAKRAAKTHRFYRVQLCGLISWAHKRGLFLDEFTKRHLDEYLIYRAEAGISQTTLHHDALAAKVFFKWCQKNDIVDRSPLSDYEVRNAPRTNKYMPTQEDMQTLLKSISGYYDPLVNEDARYLAPAKRSFHRERNFAIILLLLDSACRIGEILSLKLENYQAGARQFTVVESKGRTARPIPVSKQCVEAVAQWLKVRTRIMRDVAADEDEGWLFVSELGGKIDESKFLKGLHRITAYAKLTDRITLHSLRRYSLNRLAKHNLFAAQAIAGHKDPKTTLIYTEIDPEFLREQHEQVGVVRGVLSSKRASKRKRLI